MVKITPDDLLVMMRTLYGEARGETWPGMVAVAHVIINRAEADLHGDQRPDWWGEGLSGVCLKPAQFSCWNRDDPNRHIIETLAVNSSATSLACFAAVTAALLNVAPSPVGRATHYHTLARPPWLASHLPWPPRWASTLVAVGQVGRHVFYRDPAAVFHTDDPPTLTT